MFAPRFESSDYAAMLDSLIPELAGAEPGRLLRGGSSFNLRLLVQLGTRAHGAPRFHCPGRSPGARPHVDGAVTASIAESLDADQVFNIQFTSGTTGTPKGLTPTHFNIVNNGFFVGEGLRLCADDSVCIPVPLSSLLRHAVGRLAAMTPRRSERAARRRVRAGVGAADRGARALHRAVRAADHVHRGIGSSGIRASSTLLSLRTGIMAGSLCPIAVMRRVVAEDAICRN